MNYKCYLAGAISGLDYFQGQGWRDVAREALDRVGIKAYSPLRGKSFLKDKGIIEGSYEEHPLSTQKGLFIRDLYDCRTCDLLIANLLELDRISIGTVFEISTCYSCRIPIILIMEDGGIHTHPFILEASSYIVKTLDEAIDLAKLILLNG